MRGGIIVVAALTFMTATGARADEWCGFTAHANAMIECGYSSDNECESALGKAGTCFIDPDYAMSRKGFSIHRRPLTSALRERLG